MTPMIIGRQIVHRDRVSSTNDEAEHLLKTGNPVEGTIITARYQEAGRGHGGTAWISEPGKNLLVSVIFKPEFLEPRDQFFISIVVSLGVRDFAALYLDEVTIKWPNDIYTGNDKIAGILIENVITGGQFTYAIGGVGINVNQKTFPDTLFNPTSIALHLGNDLDLNGSLELLAASIDNYYQLLREGRKKDLMDRYSAHLYRRGEWTLFRSGGEDFEGSVSAVEHTGVLLVTLRSGKVKRFQFKELVYL